MSEEYEVLVVVDVAGDESENVEMLAPDSTDVFLGEKDIAVIVAVGFDGAVDIGVDPTVEESRGPALIEDVLGRPERQSS